MYCIAASSSNSSKKKDAMILDNQALLTFLLKNIVQNMDDHMDEDRCYFVVDDDLNLPIPAWSCAYIDPQQPIRPEIL